MKRILLVPVALLLAHCASETAPEVTARTAGKLEVSPEALENGRQVYLAQCAQCHQGTPPGSADAAYWRTMLPHIQRNSTLTAADEADLLNYLVAAYLDARPVRERD